MPLPQWGCGMQLQWHPHVPAVHPSTHLHTSSTALDSPPPLIFPGPLCFPLPSLPSLAAVHNCAAPSAVPAGLTMPDQQPPGWPARPTAHHSPAAATRHHQGCEAAFAPARARAPARSGACVCGGVWVGVVVIIYRAVCSCPFRVAVTGVVAAATSRRKMSQ